MLDVGIVNRNQNIALCLVSSAIVLISAEVADERSIEIVWWIPIAKDTASVRFIVWTLFTVYPV